MDLVIDPSSARGCAAFLGGSGRIPNNPVVATVLAALFCGGPSARQLLGGWQEGSDGTLTYTHFGRRGGQVSVQLDAREPMKGEGAAPWDVVEAFSALTVDVALIVLAELCDPRLGSKVLSPRRGALGISASAILEYKDYRRWGRERAEFLARVGAEVESLARLRIDISGFPGWDTARRGWSAEGVSITDDRLFVISADGGSSRGDAGGQEGFDLVWPMRLGRWSDAWLNAQGKVWTIDLPAGLVTLDHRPNRPAQCFAKKVGINSLVLLGMLKSRPVLVRRVDHLLESVGELPAFATRTAHWAGRTRDRLEEAAFILSEHGIIGGIRWPDAADPGALQRQKGWVEHWLAAKIEISRPVKESVQAPLSADIRTPQPLRPPGREPGLIRPPVPAALASDASIH